MLPNFSRFDVKLLVDLSVLLRFLFLVCLMFFSQFSIGLVTRFIFLIRRSFSLRLSFFVVHFARDEDLCAQEARRGFHIWSIQETPQEQSTFFAYVGTFSTVNFPPPITVALFPRKTHFFGPIFVKLDPCHKPFCPVRFSVFFFFAGVGGFFPQSCVHLELPSEGILRTWAFIDAVGAQPLRYPQELFRKNPLLLSCVSSPDC